MWRSLTQYALRENTAVPYISFTSTNLSTLNLPQHLALSTLIRGSERRSVRVVLPNKRTQSCKHEIKI